MSSQVDGMSLATVGAKGEDQDQGGGDRVVLREDVKFFRVT